MGMAKGEIICERLSLIPFSEKYLSESYVRWLNDPEVIKYSEQRHRKHTLNSCREYMLSFIDTPHLFWAIVCKDEKLGHIGNINAYVDLKNRVADIGIIIGERTVWGKGYGLEAWRAVCDYMLRDTNTRKVAAGTLANNIGMIKIMERTGMEADGIRRKHYLFEDKEVDIVFYARYKDSEIINEGGA